jgi:hypothetical protein
VSPLLKKERKKMHLRSATMLSQQRQTGVLETIEPPSWSALPLTAIKQYCLAHFERVTTQQLI